MRALTRRHPPDVALVAPAPSSLTPAPPALAARSRQTTWLTRERSAADAARAGRGIYRSVTFLFEKRRGSILWRRRERRALARMRVAAYVNAADRLDPVTSVKSLRSHVRSAPPRTDAQRARGRGRAARRARRHSGPPHARADGGADDRISAALRVHSRAL